MAPLDPISEAGDFQHDPHAGGASGNGTPANANGMLAKIGTKLPSVSSLNWSYGPPPRPEILSSKPNPLELLHAVRRRWPLALGLGMLVSGLVAGLLWFLVPVKYEAYALLKVSGRQPSILEKGTTPADEFMLFKATQGQLVASNMVANNVLRGADINQLESVRQHSDDPVSWLKDELMVDFPGDAELMRIAIKTKRPEDSLKIVDKVVAVYLAEIVERDKALKLANENKLQAAYERQGVEYEAALKQLSDLEKTFKTTGSEAAQLKKRIAVEELNSLMGERTRISDMLSNNAMETMLLETKMGGAQTAAPPDALIEMELEKDPVIAQLKQQLAFYQEKLSHIRGVSAGASPTGYAAEIQGHILRIDESIAEHKAESKPRLLELYASGGTAADPRFPLSINQLKKQGELLDANLADADAKLLKKTDEVTGLESFSAQVAAKQEEIEGKRLHKNDLGLKVDQIKIERLAAERITEIQKAELEGRGDAIRKYVAIAFATLLSFAGVVLAVAVMEFQSRKVNSVKEVNDGLGIRVIGELPNISGRAFRRVRGGKGQNVLKALMAERIDGTRTALIHTTAIDPPRVVMVTSAQPHEGKTTTSSQLAASLARSGRRTLLIDADIRNPGVHRVFEMPQDPGLCELLRGETERDAVIHPTRTANLWLMPAGRCDLRSVQALSGSYLGSAIAALSVQFDYVIIDAGPVLKVADPLLVGQHVDAAIISVLRDVSKVPQVYEAVERLRSVGITVLGSVVNGVKDDVARHGVELLMAETPRQEKETTSA